MTESQVLATNDPASAGFFVPYIAKGAETGNETNQPWYSRTGFLKKVNEQLDGNLSAPEKKLLQKHLGEHDPDAEICKVKGAVEPDSDLRDHENVPLGEAIEDYFAREVTPHIPAAWIDESKRYRCGSRCSPHPIRAFIRI